MNLENLNLNIFNILIISGVIHGIIFGFVVFTQNDKVKKSTIYLGLTVLFLSLSNLQYWLIDINIIKYHPFLKYTFIPWQWLVLPMFYLYVYKLTHKGKIPLIKNIFLIAPFGVVFLIHTLNVSYKLFIDNEYDISSHFERGIYVYIEFLSFYFNLVIMLLSYKLIKNYEEDQTYDDKWIKSETNWLKKLIYLGLTVCIFWFIALILVVVFNLNKSYFFYPLWIGNSILVYWIGYVGLSKSKQLKQRILLRKKRNIKATIDTNKINTKAFNTIESKIIKAKLYLNPNINLEYLSKYLDLSDGYISQQINANSGMNFNDYINTLRIENAKQILSDLEFDNYTIVSIGLESGFNSKSSFYTAFKKFTGKTPLQYKKDVRNL